MRGSVDAGIERGKEESGRWISKGKRIRKTGRGIGVEGCLE